MKRSVLAVLIVSIILIIDQCSKIWVKLNMAIGDSFNMFGENQDWAEVYFVENPGMAFGLDWGAGKIVLSLFRMLAIGFIIFYLRKLIIEKRSWGTITAIALILAGASGNLIDNMFYGLMFTESSGIHIAEITSFGSGYAGFLLGDVVDMLHFPMVEGNYPAFMGGGRFVFFAPIFNIADSSVFCGVVTVVIFYKQFSADFSFKKKEGIEEEAKVEDIQDSPSDVQDEMV